MLPKIFCNAITQSKSLTRTSSARLISTRATNSHNSNAFKHVGKLSILTRVTGGAVLGTSLLAYSGYGGASASCAEAGGADSFVATALFPSILPYEEGMLKVSNIHTIAYFVYGNPNGKAVLVVHGGPGAGTTHDMARYFDPKYYRIVLVDQRGCGKSTPFADLTDNTTWDSIRDFEKLRVKLNIDKWQVFGGSWGSTLALAYATEHPERVTELVLRGIFTLTDKELKWMYQGPGGSFIFPEDWAGYEAAIPEEERGDYMKAYGRRLRGELGAAEMHKAAKAWSIWEGRISRLVQEPAEDIKGKFGDDHFSLAFARIENHYFTNRGFFPREGYLLEPAQLKKIQHIPTVIVQGRYDVVCPPVSAYLLHKGLPKSELVYTLTGHSGFEPDIIKELVKATERFKSR